MAAQLLVPAVAWALFMSPALAASSPKYLITFGDSYSQTGFDITGEKPSASNPIGNPTFPGYTASGGVNWVGSLAAEYNSSLTLAYNFAYGGATVDADIVAPYVDTVLTMEDQVALFSANLAQPPDYAPWTAANTVVGVWMGVNDLGNTFWLDNSTDIYDATLIRYFELLQTVYDAGVRKFVLLSVPPTNLTPLMIAQGSTTTTLLATAISYFNKELSSKLEAFEEANSGITAEIVDTSVAFNKAINDPESYGAPDALCDNTDGVSCLWYNNYHPGIAIERLVASDVGTVVNGEAFAW